jgi:hypothetical protein
MAPLAATSVAVSDTTLAGDGSGTFAAVMLLQLAACAAVMLSALAVSARSAASDVAAAPRGR